MQDKPEMELKDYRPVSVLAIVSLIFGLLSILSLLHLVFVAAGLFGTLFSVLALIQIRNSDKSFIGGKLAWVAIFLCCVFSVAALSAKMIETESRWRTARGHADEWFRLMQEGELEKVHHLTLPNHDRQGPDVDLTEYYAPENRAPDVMKKGVRQPQTGYESYWEMLEPQKTIIADKTDCKIEFVSRKEFENENGDELYTMVYRLTPADPKLKFKKNVGENQQTIYFPLEFEIRMHRARPRKSSGIQWHVHLVRIEGVRQTNNEITIE